MAGARGGGVPSVWYENNPRTVLESFAQGTPVIGSSLGGIPELIGANERGIVIPPHDAIALQRAVSKLHADPELARALGDRGREYVRAQMDPEKHYTKLIEIYTTAKK